MREERSRVIHRIALATLLLAVPLPAASQTPLTLADAMLRARTLTPEARTLAAQVSEADARVRQARSSYFPRVDFTETVQRGNQPVFVFSSLLAQRRFTEADFAIAALTRPDPVTNTRSSFAVEQPLYDAGLTRLAVEAATLRRDVLSADRARAEQNLAVRAAQAFVRVLQYEAAVRASAAAVAAADSDLERARARRDTGVVTDADVLAVEVHLANMRQRQIATAGDLAIAHLQLADAVGLPLDASVTAVVPPVPVNPPAGSLIEEALRSRSERRQAELRERLADNGRRTARASYLPTLGVQGGWELNGSSIADQRSSWVVGAQLHINLFRGFADAARLVEARHAQARARAEREQIDRSIEVDVRTALVRLTTARARQDAGRASLAQARESQRIIRDRYDGGLATVTDVLRAAEAVLDAESRSTAADMDVIVESVSLDRALGRL